MLSEGEHFQTERHRATNLCINNQSKEELLLTGPFTVTISEDIVGKAWRFLARLNSAFCWRMRCSSLSQLNLTQLPFAKYLTHTFVTGLIISAKRCSCEDLWAPATQSGLTVGKPGLVKACCQFGLLFLTAFFSLIYDLGGWNRVPLVHLEWTN